MSEENKRPCVANIVFDENRCCDPRECPFMKTYSQNWTNNTCELHCVYENDMVGVIQPHIVGERCHHTEETFIRSLKVFFEAQEIYNQFRQCGGCRFAKIDDSLLTDICLLRTEISCIQKGYYAIGSEFFCCHGQASFDRAIDEFKANFPQREVEENVEKAE